MIVYIIINHHARNITTFYRVCYVDFFYKYFILVYCVYMINLKLVELTLAIYAFIIIISHHHRLYHINSHILSIICTQQRLYHHHHRRYELSTSLYATYHPLSTYNIIISHLISWLPFLPSQLFDASMYVDLYVLYVCMM